MKNFPAGRLVAGGLFLSLAGFIYASIFAGVPYQDPTPEMAANYAFHTRTSTIILLLSLGILLVGLIGGVSKITLFVRSTFNINV